MIFTWHKPPAGSQTDYKYKWLIKVTHDYRCQQQSRG